MSFMIDRIGLGLCAGAWGEELWWDDTGLE